MGEYIACRSCNSPDCKGCNLKRLETMLENGKFDCLMNENRCINTSADVEPVVRCRECKHLNVLNRKELYAHCPKTNTVFLPFELDAREHFCSLGERKDGDGNG